jgi:hypothetical protein
MHRRRHHPLALGLFLALTVAAVFATSSFAAKPSSYSPTLSVKWPTLATTSTTSATSTNYLITGCGYNSSFGGVTIVVQSPVAISFAGGMPDANGCISVSNFWTQGPGRYQIDAWQTTGKKDVIVATTSFTL